MNTFRELQPLMLASLRIPLSIQGHKGMKLDKIRHSRARDVVYIRTKSQ